MSNEPFDQAPAISFNLLSELGVCLNLDGHVLIYERDDDGAPRPRYLIGPFQADRAIRDLRGEQRIAELDGLPDRATFLRLANTLSASAFAAGRAYERQADDFDAADNAVRDARYALDVLVYADDAQAGDQEGDEHDG